MSVEKEIEKLRINSSLDGLLLLSLFATHQNKKEVLNYFRSLAEKMIDSASGHQISDSYISSLENRVQEILSTLEAMAKDDQQ